MSAFSTDLVRATITGAAVGVLPTVIVQMFLDHDLRAICWALFTLILLQLRPTEARAA